MHPLTALLLITTLTLAKIVPILGQNSVQVVVKGEVIDVKCYMEKGADATGKAHKECAVRCAHQGVPLAILEEGTNNVYYTVKLKGGSNANDMLLPFVAEKVLAKGKLIERGGTRLLFIKSIEKPK